MDRPTAPGTSDQSGEEPNAEVPKVPAWAFDPLSSAMDRLELVQRVRHLSMKGISVLRGMPRIVELLQKYDEGWTGSKEKSLAEARLEAKLGQREVDEGFPLLHAQSVLSLAALLEATVQQVVGSWIEHEPASMQSDKVASLKVELGEYESLDAEDRASYVTELLEQKLAAGLQGVSRFEALLAAMELTETVHEPVRRVIFELFKVRNVLLHKDGRTDRKLAQECPWLDLTVGEQLRVSEKMLGRYEDAITEYLTSLVLRTTERFRHGIDLSKERQDQARRIEDRDWEPK